ncbi:GntR family transcriptional regulator [Clostridium sp. JS66]|uniref:GntR family transcriptional regulator n=1 Tax=Clostridium sp. JS66 TaxID=3064705 RepID=UPI00298E2D64|nr:GntR family transcriptional regulator [Clostridium sp. JS66]WPC40408.1 GntR family transcriptional regulator [Clostridium sp. JS66]
MSSSKKQELTLKYKAYEFIKEKIINCEMKPGSDISEDDLMEQLKTSRTPIREALMKLEQEGLVDIFPRKGIFVAQITFKDIHDIFEIRQIIEIQMAKVICDNIPTERLLYFKEKFEQMDEGGNYITDRDFFHLDLEFHKTIVETTGNNYLIEFMNKIYDKDYRIRVLTTRFKEERKRNKMEHLNIINSILDKDKDKIEKYLMQHIENSKHAALKII